MAIDIGDAILTVLVDQTQANAQLAQMGGQITSQMGPATAAITQTTNAVDEMGGRMAVGAQGAKELGEVTTLSGEKAKFSMYEARGEAGLLGEMFGIHLPRHVRSFIAELPGVGTALSSAFAATAILFIIEAIAKGVEKIIEWREETHKLELAQMGFEASVAHSFDTLDEKLLRAQIKADELRGDHIGALRKEIELLNLESLGQLEKQFEGLSKAAETLFKQMEGHWFLFTLGSKGAEAALTDFHAKYQLLLAERKPEEANDLLAGTLKSAEKVLDLMQQLHNIKGSPNDTLEEGIRKSEEAQRIARELKDLKAGDVTLDEKALKAQEDLVGILRAQVAGEKEIKAIKQQEIDNKQAEEAKKAAEEAKKAAKERADAQKKADKEVIDSVTERIREEQTLYKKEADQSLEEVNRELKARKDAAKEELADALANAKAQEKVAEDTAKREVDAVKSASTEQEKAIDQLAKEKVLSHTRASALTVAIEEKQAKQTLAILQKLLLDEKALLAKTETQLAEAKNNPWVSPEQIRQAEALLAQLKTAVANTESQITKVQTDTQTRQLARDRSYYGQSLALAIATGNKLLSQKLKENHAALLSAQAQLKDAQAHKENTKAIEEQIKSLKKIEGELNKEAHAAGGLGIVMGKLKDQADEAMTGMAEAVGTAMEAMVSHQESFGAAMEASTFRLIGKLAQEWAQYFAAKAIADIWWNPALGAAELAAAAALYAVGGAMSGLASNAESKGSSAATASGTPAPAAGSPAATAGSTPTHTVNIPHLAAGGLMTRPGVVAFAETGPEAAIPLHDRQALQAIASAITAQMRGGGGNITIHLKTDTHQFVKELNHDVKTGRVVLHASHSKRVTRQS